MVKVNVEVPDLVKEGLGMQELAKENERVLEALVVLELAKENVGMPDLVKEDLGKHVKMS